MTNGNSGASNNIKCDSNNCSTNTTSTAVTATAAAGGSSNMNNNLNLILNANTNSNPNTKTVLFSTSTSSGATDYVSESCKDTTSLNHATCSTIMGNVVGFAEGNKSMTSHNNAKTWL